MKNIITIANQIISRKFEDLNDQERREYLRDHQDSRWNPGKSRTPSKKRRRKKTF